MNADQVARERRERAALRDMSNRYEDLVAYMEENPA